MEDCDESQLSKQTSEYSTNIQSELSMFSQMIIDDEGTIIDVHIILKKYQSKTDGDFQLVIISEIDVMSKMVTRSLFGNINASRNSA